MAGPDFSIQVVPAQGMRSGLLAGFVIATLEGGTEVAYFDTAVRGLTTGGRSEVAEAARLFETIRIECSPEDVDSPHQENG